MKIAKCLTERTFSLYAGTRTETEQMIQFSTDGETREQPESKLKNYGFIALASAQCLVIVDTED